MAQTAAVRATTEATRLSQAIRRPAAKACSIRATPSSNALRTAAAFMRAASSAVTRCYFELPVARRLSSAVRAPLPARTKRFDSCQVQLETRSAIFVVGRHFVQGAPFAIPTAPRADLWERNPADPYMTALCYFNALRELGGARRIVEDEVRDRAARYGVQRRRADPGAPLCWH
jgi:hypothetical protein